MIEPVGDYLPSTFNKDLLGELKQYFDIDFVNATVEDRATWFSNLYSVAKHDVGIAHCINQHQSSRNYLNVAGQLTFQYPDRLGCFSTYHDIDTVNIRDSKISGTKNWITSLTQADYVVCKVGHHSDPNRALVYIDLDQTAYQLADNGYNPIGLQIAKPMSLILKDQTIPNSWILDHGSFEETAKQNATLSFSKYGFLTNFLGCAVGMFNILVEIANQKNYHLEYQFKTLQAQLLILKQNWLDHVELSNTETLDQKYWTWYDAQYNQTKQCLTEMLKLVVETGSSRFYDSTNHFSQRFRDALVWNSHGKPHYEQVLLTKFAQIN